MAEKGGRTYVSKEELSLIESIKSEKQEILDIEQQELANIKALQDAYKNTGDESLKLTDAMKERLRVSEVENTLKTETSSLEKKLSKQAQSLNTKKKKGYVDDLLVDAFGSKVPEFLGEGRVGDRDAKLDAYYQLHHTDPDDATIKRAESIIK